MAGRNKPLVMVIDGNVDGLKTAARAAQNVLQELENGAVATREAYIEEFDKIANVSQEAMDRMAKGIQADFARMRREAEQASRSGIEFAPTVSFTSQGQQLYADNARKAAAAAFEQESAFRAAAAAGGELGKTLERAANEALANAKALTLDADAAELVADELRKVELVAGATGNATEEAGRQSANASGAMRAGFQQVGFQISDFAVQVGGGTSAIRAASQQAPQLIQALALMGGGAEESQSKFGRFATFLGGPYGAAITIGVSVLGLLASSLLDADEASDKAENATFDFSKSLDFLVLRADAAQAAIKQLVGETERLLRVQGNFDRQIAANAERSVEQGQTRVGNAQSRITQLEEGRFSGPDGLGVYLAEIGAAREELRKAQAFLADAKTASQNAQLALSQRAVEERRDPNQAKLNKIDENIGAIGTRRNASIDVERLDPRIRTFELRKRGAIYISEADYEAELLRLQDLKAKVEKAQRDANSTRSQSGEQTRTNAQVFTDFKAELAKEGITQAAGRTGFRSAADQNEIFRAGQSPLDGYRRKSRHQSYQAFDPTRASHDDEGAYRAAQAAGLKGFKIVTESGGRKHYEWTGAGPKGLADVAGGENADRAAERREEEARRNREALDGAMLASKEEQAKLARLGVTDATKLAELDIAAIDAALERKLAQNAKLELDHSELDALDRANAETEKRAVREKLRADIADRALEEERRQIGVAAQLIELEGQLARTTREKHAAAKKLLDLRYRDEKIAAEQQFGKDGKFEPYLDNLGLAQTRRDVDGTKLGEQYRGPTADYAARLKELTGDMDEAFDGIAARGLASLEDGLVGIITGTEDVATAFKRMAASILADLARIAVQKLILSAFGIGFRGGDVPAKATGHIPGFAAGIISGPGTGTSDSILAFHEGMGLIRVSNGESIITAEGTRKHRRLLKAINDNQLPAFAGGMVGDVAYPAVPSASSLRAGGAPPVHYFDLRGSVVLEELYRSMHQISAAHAGRALAAAPGLAMDEMAANNAQRIPV